MKACYSVHMFGSRWKSWAGTLLIFAMIAGGCVPAQEASPTASVLPAALPSATAQPNIIVLTPTQSSGFLLPTPGLSFCDNPKVQAVLAGLKSAINNQDGTALSSLVDPVDGLDIYYTFVSPPVNVSVESASELFVSTFSYTWGDHPGSGLPVEGAFSVEILPSLLDVINRPHTQACQSLETGIGSGPTTAVISWPEKHSGMPFIALFRAPGPQDNELDWRTWAVGFSVVNGEPKIRILVQYFWEI